MTSKLKNLHSEAHFDRIRRFLTNSDHSGSKSSRGDAENPHFQSRCCWKSSFPVEVMLKILISSRVGAENCHFQSRWSWKSWFLVEVVLKIVISSRGGAENGHSQSRWCWKRSFQSRWCWKRSFQSRWCWKLPFSVEVVLKILISSRGGIMSYDIIWYHTIL